MKVLLILICFFCISAVASKIFSNSWSLRFSGNLAMCAMLCFTAMGHFLFTKGMALMIPDWIPFKISIVYLTGIIEILLGIGLLFPHLRFVFGLITIAFFLLIIPANIHATFKHLNFETATFDGKGPSYLWFRIPLQAIFIGWVIFFSIQSQPLP
jgi:uncharacterized membrane protein